MNLNRILAIIFFISIFIIFFLPFSDNDFGWHFMCGEKILNEKKVCTGSEFQYFLPNYKWANPNFLYDILIAFIFNNFGFLGLSILGSIIFTAIILILYKSSSLHTVFKIIIIYLAIFLSWQVFELGFRSQIVSLFFTFITFHILFKTKQGNYKKLFWLIPLFLIWANTHPGFFLGPLIFGVFVLSQAVSLYRDKIENRIFFIILFIFLIALLATFINPFGMRIYEEVYNHFKMPLNTLIAEWTAPNISHIILIILISGAILIYSVWTKKLSLFAIFVLIIFTLFAIKARRNLSIYYFYFSFFFLNFFRINIDKKLNNILQESTILVIVFLVIFFAPNKIVNAVNFDTNYDAYCNLGYVKYPCQAAEFIREFNKGNLKGNIFNTYEWGGFLVWQLKNMNVFIDGRMPAWNGENNESPYSIWLKILQTRNGWREKLEFYKTDYLFIGPGTFLDLKLQENPESYGYREIYRDNRAVIYMSLKH